MLTDKELNADLTKKQLKQLVAKHRKQYDAALQRGDTIEAEAHMKAVRNLGRKSMKEEVVNELSKNLLKRYRKKADDQFYDIARPETYTSEFQARIANKRAEGSELAKKKMKKIKEEVEPMIYNDQPDIAKLNELLEDILAKPFTSSFVAVQAIRAALDLFGITLPKTDIEQDIEGPKSLDALSMLHAGKRPPPADTDCEYAFKITPAHVKPDEDGEVEGLYLYMVINLDDDTGHYDAYATVVDDADLNKLINIDVPAVDHENPDQEGDDSGETKWNQRIRHTGTTGGSGGMEKG